MEGDENQNKLRKTMGLKIDASHTPKIKDTNMDQNPCTKTAQKTNQMIKNLNLFSSDTLHYHKTDY